MAPPRGIPVRHGNVVVHAQSLEQAVTLAQRLNSSEVNSGGPPLLSCIGQAANHILDALTSHFGLQGKAAQSLGTALRVRAVRSHLDSELLKAMAHIAVSADAVRHLTVSSIGAIVQSLGMALAASDTVKTTEADVKGIGVGVQLRQPAPCSSASSSPSSTTPRSCASSPARTLLAPAYYIGEEQQEAGVQTAHTLNNTMIITQEQLDQLVREFGHQRMAAIDMGSQTPCCASDISCATPVGTQQLGTVDSGSQTVSGDMTQQAFQSLDSLCVEYKESLLFEKLFRELLGRGRSITSVRHSLRDYVAYDLAASAMKLLPAGLVYTTEVGQEDSDCFRYEGKWLDTDDVCLKGDLWARANMIAWDFTERATGALCDTPEDLPTVLAGGAELPGAEGVCEPAAVPAFADAVADRVSQAPPPESGAPQGVPALAEDPVALAQTKSQHAKRKGKKGKKA
mmetsp:Transcript_62300/g.190356  ORF Transcript_62300/g.190356 Transcript_62300/m.190356 type:complete len:455 (-) Transcript_62300:359-1723(-)